MKNLQQPIYPIEPRLPSEPIAPEKKVKVWQDFPIVLNDNFEKIVNKAKETNVALTDIVVHEVKVNSYEYDFEIDHDYYCRGCSACSSTFKILKLQYSTLMPNPNFCTEIQKYSELIKTYEKDLAKYNSDLQKYPAKLLKYEEEMKEFHIQNTEKQIKSAEDTAKNLKSKLEKLKNESSI